MVGQSNDIYLTLGTRLARFQHIIFTNDYSISLLLCCWYRECSFLRGQSHTACQIFDCWQMSTMNSSGMWPFIWEQQSKFSVSFQISYENAHNNHLESRFSSFQSQNSCWKWRTEKVFWTTSILNALSRRSPCDSNRTCILSFQKGEYPVWQNSNRNNYKPQKQKFWS